MKPTRRDPARCPRCLRGGVWKGVGGANFRRRQTELPIPALYACGLVRAVARARQDCFLQGSPSETCPHPKRPAWLSKALPTPAPPCPLLLPFQGTEAPAQLRPPWPLLPPFPTGTVSCPLSRGDTPSLQGLRRWALRSHGGQGRAGLAASLWARDTVVLQGSHKGTVVPLL